MKQILVDETRLGLPLAPIDVRRACSYSVRFLGVPRDVSRVQVTVVKADGTALNPVPCSMDCICSWKAKLPAVLFPATGHGVYEVWGLDADGERCALGRGTLTVRPFASGDMLPVSPSGAQIITAIPDASGRLHKVVAVEVDGEYTWQIED